MHRFKVGSRKKVWNHVIAKRDEAALKRLLSLLSKLQAVKGEQVFIRSCCLIL